MSKKRTGDRGRSNPYRQRIAAALLLIAIFCMAYGIFRGEVSIIWNKAVNLCLECIGLG